MMPRVHLSNKKGVVIQIFSKKKKKPKKKKTSLKTKEKTSKHRILQQEGGLYIHNLVIRGAWNIICVYIPDTNMLTKFCKLKM